MNDANWRRELRTAAKRLLQDTAAATVGAPNEANLRHVVEGSLEKQCSALGIPWVPYQLDRTLRDEEGGVRFTDVVHGAVIIEYEPPMCFKAGRAMAVLQHAKDQAEDYANRMAAEEGRPIEEYILVAWDGAHLAFGQIGVRPKWERLQPFDLTASERLLEVLHEQGRPLVHPALVRWLIGPDTPIGENLIPALFQAVCAAVGGSGTTAAQTKTTLLFKEWGRLFGQSVGIQTDRLDRYLKQQSARHGVRYETNIPAYLLSLHTYIAIVAKLIAAMAIPNAAQDIGEPTVPLRQRLRALESGRLFVDAGIINMLGGDFFSWYVDVVSWPTIESPLADLLARLRGISFDLTHKRADSVRDLFKGIYEVFVPRELRHALGEVYTPDWLASYALDEMAWTPADDLLDPTCGTGTFLLEAIKRRLVSARDDRREMSVTDVLRGIHGIDLNPLAVLAAKASMIVVLADRLDPASPITLPVYLADAINSAVPSTDGFFVHSLQTELGVQRFEIPEALVNSRDFYPTFEKLRGLINANLPAPQILTEVAEQIAPLNLSRDAVARFAKTIEVLINLHRQEWNGIWCPILADRFAAGAIRRVSHIAGNPPWVKWSHLPPPYAKFIKPLCVALNVFSKDRYVGGIESDISTVITFQAIEKWLLPRGRLAFFITATVFANESSQGFRRFETRGGEPIAGILSVDDFKAVAPFEGVTNHPSLLVVEQGKATEYPVRYRIWTVASEALAGGDFAPGSISMQHCDLLARPVPGSDAGPWLKGSAADHEIWGTLFNAGQDAHYHARKGVTTDLNGVYFVRATPGPGNSVWVTNDPGLGRKPDLPVIRRRIENTHVFPLIRGRGLQPFRAVSDPDYKVIIPQRRMHGDPNLPISAPRTHSFFLEFEAWLRVRGSYRRYQATQPFWSTWSTGPYTFSDYKVLWKEMGGGTRFCAAYIGPQNDPVLGRVVVIPDHKLYFVPVATEQEARYLTGILNAPVIAGAISGYASQLSLGTSVIENLTIPAFDAGDEAHAELSGVAGAITDRDGNATDREIQRLSALAQKIVGEHG